MTDDSLRHLRFEDTPMMAAYRGIRREHDIVRAVYQGSYVVVFTPDDVAHVWEDGCVTWESAASENSVSSTSEVSP